MRGKHWPFYVDPQLKLCNPAAPSAFDTHVLALFDSIEGNRDDIDAQLESLRLHLKSRDLVERLQDMHKLGLVYRAVAAYLVRPKPGQSRMAMQQLFANWRKVGQIAGQQTSGVPAAWIRPLGNEVVPKRDYASGGPSRGLVVLSGRMQILLGALFLAVTGAMIVYGLGSSSAVMSMPVWIVVGVGIFVAYWIGYSVGFIRPYSPTGGASQRRR